MFVAMTDAVCQIPGWTRATERCREVIAGQQGMVELGMKRGSYLDQLKA